jgi:hypothetical protein
VDLAARKLAAAHPRLDCDLILVLIDADEDPPCTLAPKLRSLVSRTDVDVAFVCANPEYETWFVAAAESLTAFLRVSATSTAGHPEAERLAKGWIQRHFRRPKYSETVDQAAMTAQMDLGLCRDRCPSFDKLCRELEDRNRG